MKKMNNFGKLKDKILKKLTESYSSGNKNDMKNIIKLIKENDDFREMYLFYEGIENLELTIPDSAQLYVESIENILIEKQDLIKETCKKLEKYLSDVEVDLNPLYESIDVLSEKTKLTNIDKKVIAKKKLIEHLSKPKQKSINENSQYSENENLLMAVLTNNFNVVYESTLSEEDKETLKSILSMNDDILIQKTTELKEDIFNDVEKILSESIDSELSDKLNSVKEQVSLMEVTKYNYYKMLELKNGLN